MICKLCNKEFGSLSGLHLHLNKVHKTPQSEYYFSFYPRYDLNTRELISYKDYKQYHSSDFNSRDSFSEWLSDNYKEESTKEYVLQKVRERMTRKMVTNLPSHVALKSLHLPSIHGFSKMYGSLEKFVKAMEFHKIGLRSNYLESSTLHEGEMKIFCDTREQNPLKFDCANEVMKLSVGDYVPGENFYSSVYVDRKSLQDLAGTLTAGRDRVEREIQRAKDLDFFLVFVVEDLYSEALHYSSSNSFSKKLTGSHIFFSIRELMDKYDNISFVFAGNRKRAVTVIENIFRLKERAKVLDLELLKDLGLI